MRSDPQLSFLAKCGPPDANEPTDEAKAAKGSFELDDSKLDFDEDRYKIYTCNT
jgi:hypothetical protein